MSVTVRDLLTEAASRANINPRKKVLPEDLYISGLQLFDGVLQDLSSKDYMDAYQNEVDFTPSQETVIVGDGVDATVTAPSIQLPKKVLYKYNGQIDWVPMEFIAYNSFYSSSYSDYVVSWQPIGPNQYKLYFKPRFLANNPQCKLIYNVEMKFVDNDVISLPTPYIELLTRAVAYKYAMKYPRAGQEKLLTLKADFDELENSMKSNNASLKIITRGGNIPGGSYKSRLRSGSFISDVW